MFLLICAVDKGIEKMEIENRISHNNEVLELLWINGENGLKEEENDSPYIGGSISKLFKNREENILLAKLKGKEKVTSLLKEIKNIDGNGDLIHTVVLPVIA